MQILDSARKHGIPDDDTRHAWENAIRHVEYEYQGRPDSWSSEPTGTDDCSNWSRVPADEPIRIIHADMLRPKFYEYLR